MTAAGTLTVHDHLEQGTDAWLDARRGLLTASTIGALITPALRPADNETARNLIRRLAAERITGRVEDFPQTSAMLRGHLDEPLARDAYEQTRQVDVQQVGLMVRTLDDGTRLGYSPDGLVGDHGLIEIKSRNPREQIAAVVGDRVPPANLAQLHAGLWVSGRDWVDYISYCGGLPLYVKRIEPDPDWQDAIAEAVRRAEQEIAALVAAYREATEGLPSTTYFDHFAEIGF